MLPTSPYNLRQLRGVEYLGNQTPVYRDACLVAQCNQYPRHMIIFGGGDFELTLDCR